MRRTIATRVRVSGLLLLMAAAAWTPALAADGRAPAKSKPQATHSIRGDVKQIGDATVVLTHLRHRGDMVLELQPTTRISGRLVVGATASVRYVDAKDRHLATAIVLSAPPAR